jgi:hypothetical protein
LFQLDLSGQIQRDKSRTAEKIVKPSMPVRIYDIAKKLNLESKVVLAKAKELGITSARVASSSLDKITAEFLEQQMLGAAPPTSTQSESVPEPVPIIPAPEPEAVAPAHSSDYSSKSSSEPEAPPQSPASDASPDTSPTPVSAASEVTDGLQQDVPTQPTSIPQEMSQVQPVPSETSQIEVATSPTSDPTAPSSTAVLEQVRQKEEKPSLAQENQGTDSESVQTPLSRATPAAAEPEFETKSSDPVQSAEDPSVEKQPDSLQESGEGSFTAPPVSPPTTTTQPPKAQIGQRVGFIDLGNFVRRGNERDKAREAAAKAKEEKAAPPPRPAQADSGDAAVIATVSPDSATVSLSAGAWSATIRAEDLPRWIALYRGLADRKHPRTGEARA